jgi:ATP-dependent DNA helicase DinG
MSLTSDDVLGPKGYIARRLPNYESRDEQLEMATAVAEAIALKTHLVVEAGTGVGKSFAYLVPAILAAGQTAEGEKRKKIVVSTHTISLQEQLIGRDIPFLNAVLPIEFSAVLVKGRSNYVSLRRLQGAFEKSNVLFGEDEEQSQIRRLREWSRVTTDGSLADIDFRPLGAVWDEVRSEHGNCLGRRCPSHEDCFYYKARRRVWNADVLVVNHALFFSDLALRREGASVLPDYDVVILDEAHTLEAVAGDHLGITVTSGQVNYLFNKLYNDRANKGLLLLHELSEAQRLVLRLRSLFTEFFADIRDWKAEHVGSNGRLREPCPIPDVISPEMHALASMIRTYADKRVPQEEQKIELTAAADRVDGLAQSLTGWMKQRFDDSAYWIEETQGRTPAMSLLCSPIEVGPTLRDELFGKVPTVILTSATLTVGQQDFSFFKTRVGLTKADEVKLGSPFDYAKQATLILADKMPDPTEQAKQFEEACLERIQRYILHTDGRAFVLFTSYKMLKACADRLTGWFAQHNYLLLTQGMGQNRSLMLDRFRQDGRAVLFGTDTFWQGVDVPGDALQNVIITKLPFSVPDHPLLEARVERIRERGGNPFMEYQVPEAAIKLRQGFGRLIRSKTDTGVVVILDPRIRTKYYGRIFLESLPKARVVIDDGRAPLK